MNKMRRNYLNQASSKLSEVYDIVESVRDDERDAMDNYPENLQNTEVYENMEQAVDTLDDVLETLKSADDSLQDIV